MKRASRLFRVFRTAVNSLRRNVMRAVLTTLGIVIGIAAVIAMMEIGNGSAAAIQATVASMGANTLMLFPGAASTSGISFGGGSGMTLTPQDAEASLAECPAVRTVAPVVRVRAQIVCGSRNWVPMNIYGTTPQFLEVRDWTKLAEGEPFSERDVRNGGKVCLIGQTLARELFQGESPIGRELRVKNVSFRVVGVLAAKGANMMGMDQDDILLAPWTTIKYRVSGQSATTGNQSAAGSSGAAMNTLNNLYPSAAVSLYPERSATQAANSPMPVRFTNVDQILIAANSGGEIPAAIRQMTTLLRERHRLDAAEADDFTIRDMTEMTKILSSTSGLMTKLLLCVALISLVVGGVGIMNIMLVSVTERTHEIGLRMAVGARGRDILRQFLTEAILLCLIGGVFGILLGRGCSWIVSSVLHWPTAVSVAAIIAAVAVSAGVGIIFGFYPAWKASRMDPIEALRYE